MWQRTVNSPVYAAIRLNGPTIMLHGEGIALRKAIEADGDEVRKKEKCFHDFKLKWFLLFVLSGHAGAGSLLQGGIKFIFPGLRT